MASVIRVKRRRGEDPAEALLLSCKRLRQSEESQPESKIESVLSFAGTISSKVHKIFVHEIIEMVNEIHTFINIIIFVGFFFF